MGNSQAGRMDNNQPFLASEQVAVPIHDQHSAANQGPLHPLIRTLQSYPRILLIVVLLLAILLICALVMIGLITQTRNECDKQPDSGQGGSTSAQCGWNGKDLSALSYDLYLSPSTGVTYYLRPCGYVSIPACIDRFGGHSQACTVQQSPQPSAVWDNGDWQGNDVAGVWSGYGAGGLEYRTANGGQCGGGGGGVRSLYVYYTCESESSGYIDSIVDQDCATSYYVKTKYVC